MNSKASTPDLSRRKFLGACCASVGATGMLSSIAQLRLMGAVANTDTPARAAAPQTDYKALVCLFLAGGNDANNLVVPTDNTTYAAYADMDFDVPVGDNGDTYDRYLVRLEEMRQSRRIVQQALKNMPDGPVNAKVPRFIKPPVGDYYHSIEGPKGEIGCYLVSDGTTRPARVRVRPPSLINLQALRQMCLGHLVADVVAIIGTLDIVLGEIDR